LQISDPLLDPRCDLLKHAAWRRRRILGTDRRTAAGGRQHKQSQAKDIAAADHETIPSASHVLLQVTMARDG
jgi:hypothetical protein